MDKNLNEEIKDKWENTEEYQEYIEKTRHYSEEKWSNATTELNNILKEFAMYRNNKEINSIEVYKLVEKLQNTISNNYYSCSLDMLSNLGKMYISDERFKTTIDHYGEGTALFISKAIENFIKKHQK